jgi:uncharacterized sulfatase
MPHRALRALLVTLLLVGAATARDPVSPDPPPPPNVLLILADDQAWTDFGFMGHTGIRTPHLDRLAAESAVFRRGYVPTSLCRPSLMSIVTGQLPHRHGVTGNDPPRGVDRSAMLRFVARAPTLPRLLAAQGYRSLQTGKWWEGSFRDGGFTDGMTHGDPARGGRHGDEGLAIGRQGLAPISSFLDEVGSAPFLVWYAPFLPHAPHNPPESLLAPYREAGLPDAIARYHAMCTWFDETVGALLGELDARGLTEDTLVLFVVDNGWIQSEQVGRYAARSKRSPYEGGVRTPILLRWPGRVRPGDRDTLVSSLDIARTVLRACGAPVPDSVGGVDLVAVADGAEPARAGVVGEVYAHDAADLDDPAASLLFRFGVRDRLKLIVPTAAAAAPELYDLEADPFERQDLAAQAPEDLLAMRSWLDAADSRDRPTARRPARPNLLFLLTDDQRDDQLSCAGHPVLRTPHIDTLAARGTRFRNAFVTTAICAASRATILTGLHEGSHRFTFGTPPLAADMPTYPALLRAAGYRTGFVGKLGVRLEAEADQLFDWFRPLAPPYLPKPDARHLTDRTADAAIAFLRERPAERPFCLSVSFNAPHAEDANPAQYVPPADLAGLFADQAVPAVPLSDPEFFAALPEPLRESLNRVRWHWRFGTEEQRVAMTRQYWRMIAGVDRAVGRILAELEALGLAENTVVVFSSDNGYFLGERGFAGKWTIHEPSIRVPLIVADPRVPRAAQGRVDDAMVLNIDLAPTLLAAAGIDAPASMQGRDLGPLVRGETVEDWRSDTFYEHRFEHPRIPVSEGVRSEAWTYVRYPGLDPVLEELYDLRHDPLQARNLAADPAHAAELERLRARTAELRARYVR